MILGQPRMGARQAKNAPLSKVISSWMCVWRGGGVGGVAVETLDFDISRHLRIVSLASSEFNGHYIAQGKVSLLGYSRIYANS